ncbi:hypothetical protein D3H35_23515 [Cohnella faecalis]|uniref:Uncharacterized protein n=2 Tax=Cohnella faecalis TaxID=2315694 RepID=A0A398CQY3_9BACL|nr:hypothetical protein D3H35_23515 [Cohnella faecalis]
MFHKVRFPFHLPDRAKFCYNKTASFPPICQIFFAVSTTHDAIDKMFYNGIVIAFKGAATMVLQRIRNEQGTTLIQVLGATIILTMIILAFVSLSQFTTASNKDTDRRDQALLIAEQIVNEIRASTTTTYTTGNLTPWSDNTYSYKIIKTALTNGNEPSLSAKIITESGVSVRNQVSVQSIMLDGTGTVPQLLTVNVSWKG